MGSKERKWWRGFLLCLLVYLSSTRPHIASAAGLKHQEPVRRSNDPEPDSETQPASSEAGDKEWEGMTVDQRLEHCQTLEPLYANIDEELKTWKETGISRKLQMNAIRHHTARVQGQKGIAVGFKDGVAYVVDEPVFTLALGHHVGLFTTYLKVMLQLEKWLGPSIPDVEFVISTVDRPLNVVLNGTSLPDGGTEHEPVMRFCKTSAHTDITIPNFHSYIRQYTGALRPQLKTINDTFPWKDKVPVLFGRFTPYGRHMHTYDPYTRRTGVGGATICVNSSKYVATCEVRSHFCSWAREHQDVMDVSCQKRMSMFKHAQFKFLLHLDGQGLSSRFEQLLHLNSLVFKEESGYRAYFYHLLRPYEHYVPIWKKAPEEVLDALDWARKHDAEAQRIAANAQDFVRKYLGPAGRACYWQRLLSEYSKLLKYQPGKEGGSKYSAYWMPVSEFVEKVAKPFAGGKWYDTFKFVP